MIAARAQLLLTLTALIFLPAFSQTPAQQQNTEPRVFNVSVVNADGKPYVGLKAENFQVWVDGKPRKIVSLSTTTTRP